MVTYLTRQGHRKACFFWMVCVLLFSLVQEARGADAVADTYRYMAMLEGSGQLRLKFPVFDYRNTNKDTWGHGTIYIQEEGGSKVALLKYEGIYTGKDNGLPDILVQRGVEGLMVLKRAQGYSDVSINTSLLKVRLPSEEGQTFSLANVIWSIPRSYRGKRVTISWSVTRYEEDRSKGTSINIDPQEIDIPEAPPQLDVMAMQPILAFQGSHAGEIMIPWMIATDSVTKAQLVYKDLTLEKTVTVTLPAESTGMAYVPATHMIDSLYFVMDYIDSEGTPVTGQKSDPPISVPMLHTAQKFTAQMRTDGTVQLDWQISNMQWEDIVDGDQWEIQRNLTGSVDPNNPNWESLIMETFDINQEKYQFIDETLCDVYRNTTVSYRIRRLSTADWGWTSESGQVLTVVMQLMYLPKVETANVKKGSDWGNNFQHSVLLDWTLTPNDEEATDNTLYIKTAEDWEVFAIMVNSGNTSMSATMIADVTLSDSASMVGNSENNPFSGVFNGNGHVLTVNFSDTKREFLAPFSYINGATIRNLQVKGEITGGKHVAGLVGRGVITSENLIENCRISADVYCVSDVPYAGGIVGHNGSAKTVLRYCLFDGTINSKAPVFSNRGYAGIFIGWEDGGTRNEVYNNLDNGTFSDFANVAPNYHYDRTQGGGKAYGNNSVNHDNYTIEPNTSYNGMIISGSNMSADALVEALGSEQWQVVNSEVVPKMKDSGAKGRDVFVWDKPTKLNLYIDKYVDGKVRYTEMREISDEEREEGKATIELNTSCVDYGFRLAVERKESQLTFLNQSDSVMAMEFSIPVSHSFYFDNNVKMDTLYYEEKQTSVVLHWVTTGGDADYYRITRRDLMVDTVTVMEEEYLQQVYVDETVRPQHNYEYTVEGVNSCEGEHVSALSIVAHCVPTGLVRGYVRLIDGTALAHRLVVATPIKGSGTEGAKADSTYTDENGFYEIKGLAYSMRGEYELTVETMGDEDAFTPIIVEFNDETNMVVNQIFTQSNYFKFSGIVLYDGSSIPVVGAKFLRDGQPVRNAKGQDVVTNSLGQFSLSVPKGKHQIQVVKEGHQFKNDGYYLNADSSKNVNWEKSVAEVYLWDQTKVRLRGRVVGGHIQGDLPLGESLSKNNLGRGITMVFQLEGDNSSWIVRDQLDGNVTERHETFRHGATDPKTGEKKDMTLMDSYRQRIVVSPDTLTGEYEVLFYPVKYKVTEIYASGYSTLFQTGTVAETLDLTNYSNDSIATYSRVYHASPQLRYQQMNMLGEQYLGLKQYVAMDVAGNRDTIRLWSEDKGYAMGHPVYMAQSPVIMSFSAREEYYYNNSTDTVPDVVPLSGSKVIMQNGLVSTSNDITIELNDEGAGTYTFTPDNVTSVQTGEKALRSLTMTLLNDNTYYNQEPLKAYVMAAVAKNGGRKAVAYGGTYLLDILRDPPGATSSAYIESGSKFNYSFKCDWNAKAGFNLSLTNGTGANYYFGAWGGVGAGPSTGNINTTSSSVLGTTTILVTYNNTWNYNYEFATTERIQTSSGIRNIGAPADLYIGLTQNTIVEEATAVRVVNSRMYQYLTPREGGKVKVGDHEYNVKEGTVEVLARGYDAVNGDSVYLIRDEVMSMSTQLASTFVHSQAYILSELIPDLLRQRGELMLPQGTSLETARQAANKLGKAVYISNVPEDADNYCLTDEKGNPTYTAVYPTKDGQEVVTEDEISRINQELLTWAGFIEKNEQEKLEATELVKRYDFDGRANIQYSETFTTSTSESRYMKLPFISGLAGGIPGASALSKIINQDKSREKSTYDDRYGWDFTGVNVEVFNLKLELKFSIVLGADYNYAYGKTETFSKKAGFTLACSNKSSLLVDVYRTKSDFDRLKELSENELKKKVKDGEIVIFSMLEDDQRDAVDDGRWNDANVTTSWLSYFKSSTPHYRNFVYRTRGGVTAAPYEDKRVTEFYRPGTILDEKTVPIDNLRIWAENASVSNVPFDEPARFKIYMANESLYPDRASLSFTYFLDNTSNPKGAKVSIDGNPLSGTGYSIYMPAGQTIVKEVEIMAGDDFDYENIGISLYDVNDPTRVYTQKLSAHFVPSAGKVNIRVPGDKWVVNTESEYDADRQDYFLPVQIDGFNVNFRNFDHIELQYKLTTQGDKNWVNVCSYYHDRNLMAQASGARDTIPNDGLIRAMFYGEKSPIEQQYDLRAVVYCRYGNGYLTNSSNILNGIKDTRRPQLFGTPMPNDGVLGIGSNIMLRFSEPIAGNYLRDVNNFQVLGQTNNSNIALSTSLRFNGNGAAQSSAYRNLDGKSFTVDMMLNPDYNGKAMTVFSHGGGKNSLELGLTADRKLTAAFGDTVFVSKDTISFNKAMHQVQYLFDVDQEDGTTQVSFFDGSKNIGTYTYPKLYSGTGNLFLGANKVGNIPNSSNYEGGMLEFRLWNRALSPGEMSNYTQKVLTGYELGLLDNYPLNEGEGIYSYNRVVSGGDLRVDRQAWKSPDGIGMRLDGEKGFKISSNQFTRNAYQDYTLMFWFRTTDDEGTLLANGEAEKEADYANHFNFSVRKGLFNLRLGGQEITTDEQVNDGAWHHTTLTVNRSRNVGNLYLDEQLKNSFAVDTLGGISPGIYAGVTYVNADTRTRPITGHIDEIALYEMVLPENMIQNYSNVTPSGEEVGMMAYLNFSQNELQSDNSQRLMPTGLSLKRYRDPVTGELTAQRDTIVSQDVVDRLADRITYASMHDMSSVENIPFSFVVDDKDLLINLDVPDKMIEKTHVMVTVKEVADLNGNLMASPVNMNMYVYRNPLRWTEKRLNINMNYEDECSFKATITNESGQTRRYTLEGLPIWMTASQTEGRIGPLDEETITFNISPYINRGDFDEVIYLVCDNGMSEPLPVNISVRGEKPAWVVNDSIKAKNISMHLIVRVEVDGNVAHDPDDILAVFGPNHKLLGVAHINVDNSNNANEALAFVTIYNDTHEATKLRFQFFDASSGRIHVLTPVTGAMNFKDDEIMGSTANPIVLVADANKEVQGVELKDGWNWISLYVNPPKTTVNELLNNATNWVDGDALEIIDPNGIATVITCKASKANNSTALRWDKGDMELQLNPCLMYRFFSYGNKTAYLAGEPVSKYITVKKGWNRIGFMSPLNLPIGTALADYTGRGTEGDIIKSQSEFAVLASDASGVLSWKGTLTYLRSGEGYMIRHLGKNTFAFSYPTYSGNSRYSMIARPAPLFDNNTGSSMNMIANVVGVELNEGDQLVAYMGAVKCGVAEADEDGRFFLSIGPGEIGNVTFAVERAGDIVAVAPSTVEYAADAVLGSYNEPTAINFIATDELNGSGWYSVQGIKLNQRPEQPGVYILDGKKVIIK